MPPVPRASARSLFTAASFPIRHRARVRIRGSIAAAAAMAFLTFAAVTARAEQAVTLEITVKDHKFEPPELRAPANSPVTLKVRNRDSTAMEFESEALRVEKVIAPNSEAIINLRRMKPGRYGFIDEYHNGVSGVLIVE